MWVRGCEGEVEREGALEELHCCRCVADARIGLEGCAPGAWWASMAWDIDGIDVGRQAMYVKTLGPLTQRCVVLLI